MRKGDKKDENAGGLMYQQLRKLINIVVSLSSDPKKERF
jgi:hypothetical protein